jgi:hypothetical protein
MAENVGFDILVNVIVTNCSVADMTSWVSKYV